MAPHHRWTWLAVDGWELHGAAPLPRPLARVKLAPRLNYNAVNLLQEPVYLNSQETRRFLDAQHQELRGVLVELGLAKP